MNNFVKHLILCLAFHTTDTSVVFTNDAVAMGR